MTTERGDDGFVLVEVLVAATILAAAGTAAYGLGQGMLNRIDKSLDASVGMVNLEARTIELTILGVGKEHLLTQLLDGVYTYSVANVPLQGGAPNSDVVWLEVRATFIGEATPWRTVPVLLVPEFRGGA